MTILDRTADGDKVEPPHTGGVEIEVLEVASELEAVKEGRDTSEGGAMVLDAVVFPVPSDKTPGNRGKLALLEEDNTGKLDRLLLPLLDAVVFVRDA